MANAAEYWDALQRALSNEWATDIPDKLIELGWAPAENRAALVELMAEHSTAWAEDDYTAHCDCGKWLEIGYYELPNHQSAILEDSGLLTPGEPWEQKTSPTVG